MSDNLEIVVRPSRTTSFPICFYLLKLFRLLQSTMLRQSLLQHELLLLDNIIGGCLTIGKSPRASESDAINVGNCDTPCIAKVMLTAGKVSVMVLKNPQNGMIVLSLVNGDTNSLLEEPCEAKNSFKMTLPTIDQLRITFGSQLIKYLEKYQPGMIELFGIENIQECLKMQKRDFKMIFFLFSSYVSDKMMDESKEINSLWVCMFQWLMLLRYIELLLVVMTQTVQDPEKKNFHLTKSFLDFAKTYLTDISPAGFLKRSQTLDFAKNFKFHIDSFKQKLNDLRALYSVISQNILLNTTIIDSHFHEIEEMIRFHQDQVSPSFFSKRCAHNLFKDSTCRLSEISHASDTKQFMSNMRILLENNLKDLTDNLLYFFKFQDNLISRLINLKIGQLKKEKELLDAEEAVMRAKIRSERSKQELFEETRRTELARIERRDFRDPRYPRDFRDPRDPHDFRDHCDPRDFRDPRDPRDFRDPRVPRDFRDPRDPRDFRDPRDPRDFRDHCDPHDFRNPRDPRYYSYFHVPCYIPREGGRERSRSPYRR